MKVDTVALDHFRNFKKSTFKFNPALSVILGPNALGKTNLLEAIYFISWGVGFRESKEQELIQIGQDNGSVSSHFVNQDETLELRIFLKREGESIIKKYTVNRAQRKSHQYKEESVPSILFSPEQIRIVNGPPDARRDYFNRLLSLHDPEYKKRLVNYEHALRKRNKILETHHSKDALVEELSFWNTYLIEQATYLVGKRQEYVDFLNSHPHVGKKEFIIDYEKSEMTSEKLDDILEKEMRYRRTLIGPQKDDFILHQTNKKGKKNLHHFGSRSEQRMAVFWLKLNEIKHEEEKRNIKPILLLDDIFSELDHANRELVLMLVKDYQTVMTTTEKEVIELVEGKKTVIEL